MIQSVSVAEHIGLAELKQRAKLEGYTTIIRLTEGAQAVPLQSWKGVTSDVGGGYYHVGASYGLSDNTVIAHKRGEAASYYRLS
jgi:hypothetical protein